MKNNKDYILKNLKKINVSNMMYDLRKAITNGDDKLEKLLDIYTHWNAVQYRKNYSNYAKMFGLCSLLNIKNIYDIGCGQSGLYHAFLLSSFAVRDVLYTGIDCWEKLDFDLMNKMFSEGWGNRIKFEKNRYPCHIENKNNNIALQILSVYTDSNSLTKMAKSLSGDFERIIVEIPMRIDNEKYNSPLHKKHDFLNDYVNYINCWSEALPNFKLYDLNDHYGMMRRKYAFFTKIQKDIDFLNKIEYSFMDEQFSVEDVHLSKYYNMYEQFGDV